MGFSAEGMIDIFKNLGDNIIGAEIGVCRGRNIKAVLDRCPNIRKIYGIDPWASYPAIDAQTSIDNYIIAKKTLSSYMLDDNVELIKTTSLNAATTLFKDNFFDFVYIDGDHSEEAVFCDLHAWWPKVKSTGILCGHDFRPKDIAVRRAVKDFVNTILKNAIVIETKHHSWYIKKYNCGVQ